MTGEILQSAPLSDSLSAKDEESDAQGQARDKARRGEAQTQVSTHTAVPDTERPTGKGYLIT